MNVIGILCQDHVYGCRLSEYLMGRSFGKFCVNSYTSISNYLEYRQQSKVSIMILEDAMYQEWLSMVPSESETKMIILMDEMVETMYEEMNILRICRYVSCELILRYIFSMLPDSGLGVDCNMMKEDAMNHSGNLVIGICSPVHRCGKTSLAVALSQYLQEFGASLLISIDPRNPVLSRSTFGLTDLLFYLLKNNSDGIYQEINLNDIDHLAMQELLTSSIMHFDDLNYLPASDNAEEMRGVEDCHLCRILKELKTYGSYQYLVVDMDDRYDFSDTLQLCDVVLIPSMDDCFSKAYLSQIQNMQSSKKSVVVQLPFIRSSVSPENYYRELPWSPMATYVRQLCQDELGEIFQLVPGKDGVYGASGG